MNARFADSPDIRYSTNNPRAEEGAGKPSFKQAWQHGQRCIIPAEALLRHGPAPMR